MLKRAVGVSKAKSRPLVSLTANSTACRWGAVAVIVENHSKLDSAFVDKPTRISMNTFGVTLSFEKVRVPSLGYVGRVLKFVCCWLHNRLGGV